MFEWMWRESLVLWKGLVLRSRASPGVEAWAFEGRALVPWGGLRMATCSFQRVWAFLGRGRVDGLLRSEDQGVLLMTPPIQEQAF